MELTRRVAPGGARRVSGLLMMALLIHNLEEAASIRRALPKIQAWVSSQVGPSLLPSTTASMSW
jgi:hypothetical protein